jgi:hypothetical protein
MEHAAKHTCAKCESPTHDTAHHVDAAAKLEDVAVDGTMRRIRLLRGLIVQLVAVKTLPHVHFARFGEHAEPLLDAAEQAIERGDKALKDAIGALSAILVLGNFDFTEPTRAQCSVCDVQLTFAGEAHEDHAPEEKTCSVCSAPLERADQALADLGVCSGECLTKKPTVEPS